MDVDCWAPKVHSAKRFPAVQAAHLCNSDIHLIMDDVDGDDDIRAWFPCPLCYVEVELPVLCIHLEDEHCFDLRNAVCPICAANLGKDAIGHFMVQHAHSVKRRRKSPKSGFWSSSSPMISNDLQELSSFLGSNSMGGQSGAHEAALDPLLSPFLCNIPQSGPKDDKQDEPSSDAALTTYVKSTKPSMLDVVKEQDFEDRRQQATFLQELILSTIL